MKMALRIIVWTGAVVGTVVVAVAQWRCGVKGHEDVLCTEQDRLFVRCLNCQRETAGLTVQQQAPHREECLRLASQEVA